MGRRGDEDAQKLRILRFLRGGVATLGSTARASEALIEIEGRGAVAVGRAGLGDLVRQGLVEAEGDRLRLAAPGRALLEGRGGDAFAAPRRDIANATVATPDGPETVLVNRAESPLAQLATLKTRQGAAFLTAAEVLAGERLRADYTRGQLMPRLGANWVASVASGRRGGGVAELTDAALAARMRVERAILAVGPELSGVLVDVCCFLKGMELVERERGWPVRSAKIVLKSALGALARHYDPAAAARARRRPQTLHWGAEDYRPSLTREASA